MAEGSGPSDLTFEMLVRAWRNERENSFDHYRYHDYAVMMRPYLSKPAPVMLAAHRLAANAANHYQLSPEEVEEAKAIIRSAGMEWGSEPNE